MPALRVGVLFFGTACALQHVAPTGSSENLGEKKDGNTSFSSRRKCTSLSEVPVYVLNLDRRRDRLSAISDILRVQAPSLYEQACRVSAPDGKEFAGKEFGAANPEVITPDGFQEVIRRDKSGRGGKPRTFSSGAMALTIGHARVWEHIAQQSSPWAIIFEDDITWLHPGVEDFLCGLDERLNHKEWKIINFQPCFFPDRKYRDDETLNLKHGVEFCLGMYVLSNQAAKEALERTFPFDKNSHIVDEQEAYMKARWWGHGYYTWPPAARQRGRDTDSDVGLASVGGRVIRDCTALEEDKMIRPGLLRPVLLQ